MPKESSKTNLLRSGEFFEKYFRKPIIDIGGGDDPCCNNADIFDQKDGDANNILDYRDKCSYLTVHSSHCLEHMHDPVKALNSWWELLMPTGFLVLVVPHELFYEQHIWPSVFNRDHKCTFRLDDAELGPVSYNIKDLVMALPNIDLISVEVQTHGYDLSLLFPKNKHPRMTKGFLFRQFNSVSKRLNRMAPTFARKFDRLMVKIGWPIDQTRRGALAQIEIIARKVK